MPQNAIVPPTPAPLPVAPNSVTRRTTFEVDADAFMAAWVGHRAELIAQAANAFDNANRGAANAGEAAVSASGAAAALAAADAARTDAQTAAAQAINAPGTSASSTTAAVLALGPMSLTVQPGKLFSVGQFVSLAATAALGNAAHGQVSAYNSTTGALVVEVQALSGSGSFSAWSVTPGQRDALSVALAQMPLVEPAFDLPFWQMRAVPAAVQATGGAARLLGPNRAYRDAPANSAELDWDVATGRPRGLLVEAARSFVALHGSDLSQAAWVKSAVSVSASTLSFRGEPMWVVAKTSTATFASVNQVLPVTANPMTYVACLALMAGTSTQADVVLYGTNAPSTGAGADTALIIVDGPGVAVSVGGSHWRLTGLSALVPTLIEVRRTYFSAGESVSLNVMPDTSGSTTVGASVLVGRVSVERGVGLVRASSFVRTLGLATTRPADFYRIEGADLTEVWPQDQATVWVTYASAAQGVGVGLRLDDGSDANLLALYHNGASALVQQRVASTTAVQLTAGVFAANGRNCIAVSCKPGSPVLASVNGGPAVASAAAAPMQMAYVRALLGSWASNDGCIDGGILSVGWLPAAVSAGELARLSSYRRGV